MPQMGSVTLDPTLERQAKESLVIRLTARKDQFEKKLIALADEATLIQGELVKIAKELKDAGV